MRRTAFFVLALLAAACQPAMPSPNQALRDYAKAVQDGRYEEAYAQLSTEAKRSMSIDAFRRLAKENRADVLEMAQSLARPTTDPIVTATAKLPQGDDVRLVFEHGRWRVDGESLDLYGQATPRQAVKAFLRAFERGRYDLLVRFVPDAKRLDEQGNVMLDEGALRTSWEGPQKDDMLRVTQGLRAALGSAPIEEQNDHATMPYGQHATLALVKEHGLWKIDTFD